ncbi:uncharacterized protein LOC110704088 [Chenopodium quinoa]|uniref:uncharacterized protein LOC110704088 n=1 Tax=Chenopodium quinoa TaxID=63459 RepID=UPI000B781726|nr:uncharacterized protein LOC110704088 [Chenopodium quinoa]
MERKMIFYKSNKNVVAIIFILALVQIMIDKSESCGIIGEKCSSFLFISNCCLGYRCSKGAGHKCVEDPKQQCMPLGGFCDPYNPCCGRNYCSHASGICKQ